MVVVVTAMASNGRSRRRRRGRGHADVDDDRIGIDRRLVRDVEGVPQKELQSVTSRRQGDVSPPSGRRRNASGSHRSGSAGPMGGSGASIRRW